MERKTISHSSLPASLPDFLKKEVPHGFPVGRAGKMLSVCLEEKGHLRFPALPPEARKKEWEERSSSIPK
jgi:hypothetical protein